MDELTSWLEQRIPEARLELTRLPQVPEIQLLLLQPDYPQDRLSAYQAEALMDMPPYWCFCWASGQVLARYLLDNPEQVHGCTVVDFGSGSGVVAIAAGMAGAERVIACDTDAHALHAISVNAELNQCELECAASLEQVIDLLDANGWPPLTLICIADVFYDRENLPLLTQFKRLFSQVLIADSRLGGAALPGMENIARHASCTVPDLNESKDFNQVVLYKKQDARP